MRSLRLRQFRSFIDTGRYDLKPITLLVGANSSGKSSYLRLFPLLRQTAETPTRSPILWFGRYVDFGGFSNAMFRGADPKSITIEIRTAVELSRRGRRNDIEIPLEISVTLSAKANQTYVSSVDIKSWSDNCRVAISDDGTLGGFSVNDMDMMPYLSKKPLRAVAAGFFPLLRYTAEDEDPHLDLRHTPLSVALASSLEPLAHNRLGYAKLLAYSRYLIFQDIPSMIRDLRGFRLRHYMSPSADDPTFKKLRALTLAKELPWVLTLAHRSMTAFASRVSYLGPFRQDPQRFYRQQEVAVGQIEPHGENLAMFLRSLTRSQLRELSAFVQEYLGINVNVPDEGTHVSVFVGEGSGREHNLIDMGYGISQVLPVVAMCWATAYGINLSLSDQEQPASLLAGDRPTDGGR
jgi:hypothetical protein